MRNPSTALLAVALVGLVFHTGCDSRYPEINASVNLAADENKVLTLAKFERIQPGMTYTELLALLDLPPDRRPLDLSDVRPRTLTSITWYDASHTKAIKVHLRGRVVIEKWQSGLE
jgi:hypothetical protein